MSWAFDNLPVVGFDDYHAPLPKPRGGYPQGCCERCGREVPPPTNWNKEPKRFCSELCRKRAERARWKARWKIRGVNKYIGAAQ